MSTSGAAPITVGVADSQHTALAFAAEEARIQGCAVRVVHGFIVPPSPPQAMSAAYGVDIEGSFRESGREVLADAVEYLTSRYGDVTVEQVLERGPASRVLIDASATSRLLVLGQDDATPWYSRLFRSRVSRDLTVDALCPVVVVPDTWSTRTPADGVTLLLDQRSSVTGAVRFAFENASRHDGTLHAVHVGDTGTREGPDMRTLVDSWCARYPGVQVATSVVPGAPDPSTVKSFARTGLLVLGRPREHLLPGLPDKSLARAVIEHAGCPVAVVPDDHDL
ncbi:universal stress protein [Aeromicrobium wangtongii]|uniref:universal stress protein n=1 Tax=Aeromicrobium wangtongii TaxID=2969247 RepID=UPI00201814DF|nr:universal stress protein [Aeromicrobium wangtongii]MCL3819326.1 universal stress protein [Aeromicrobium wangtongii]